MGRKRRRARPKAAGSGGGSHGGGGGGGMLSSMRGGFRSVVGAGGAPGEARPPGALRRWAWNLVTLALLATVIVVLLRRFGLLHWP